MAIVFRHLSTFCVKIKEDLTLKCRIFLKKIHGMFSAIVLNNYDAAGTKDRD